MTELPKAYEPASVEPHWYEFWEKHGVFSASLDPDDRRPVYVIPMPPPNVTGSLHIGHALYTIQDVIIRHARMRGMNTLWQPGIDHAGISTQVVVERILKREGKTRHELGRDAFIARVFEWKEKSGGRILEQMRVLGFSADWPRSKFTMDSDLSRAVREAFVRLYEEGLIYRATRLVNWDVESRTVLSDLEVETQENVQGEMYEFAYQVADADASLGATELVVATTRPETMLGDSAVAVHPDDPRYKHLHGKKLKHPFVAREIPVITDSVLVDMAFGTGAVKVTPAHDFNDFATGKRHGLAEIVIFELDGRMNENTGEFAGLDRFVARKAVKKRLEELGFARGSKPHMMTLPRSQRTNAIVEPMISTQWFVKMQPLAEPALQAVRDGRTRIVPEEWVKTWEHWLNNIQDWCISRQLWWGHQIPAFYCKACGHVNVARIDPTRCEQCGGAELEQDADVLDTWFSSGLWPFSTLGWPEKTLALERFYPASDLETGYDILFFWVARMMMMGLHFMGEVPFRRVLLHGMIVDETGDKMSKVKGNTLDPLDLIHGAEFDVIVKKLLPDAPPEEALTKFKKAYPSVAQMGKGFAAYGTDALRMTLASYSPQAKRIALSPARIDGYRKFCNKIYNATRFALGYVEGAELDGPPPPATLLPNRWILSRLSHAVSESTRGIEEFRLDDGSSALYHFFWDELCDWYLEATKPVFTSGSDAERAETRRVLAHVLETALRALHPYVPFVTEELWQRLPRPASRPVSIALAPYPTADDGRFDESAERDMGILMGAIGAARTVRSEHGLDRTAKVPLELRAADGHARALLETQAGLIAFLVGTDGAPSVAELGGARPRGTVVNVAGDVEVLVGLAGHVDPNKEKERIERGKKKLDKDIAVLEKRLASENFVKNAPPEVVAEARAQLEQLKRQRERLVDAESLVGEL
ncbi:MAG TPA: valine--tRNA ligase [Polyangiaceae bacterium]|nr:valine--tRNA ligase [Polyangiaceae bacterium]